MDIMLVLQYKNVPYGSKDEAEAAAGGMIDSVADLLEKSELPKPDSIWMHCE